MFSHIFTGVQDFERALAFYTPVMQALGAPLRFVDRARPWAGWQSSPGPRPLFLIGAPFDTQAHHAGNGQMVAFLREHHINALLEGHVQLERQFLPEQGLEDELPGIATAQAFHDLLRAVTLLGDIAGAADEDAESFHGRGPLVSVIRTAAESRN